MEINTTHHPSGIIIPFPQHKVRLPIVNSVEEPIYDGPISKGMWERVSKLNSNFRSDFDWKIYDQLHAKFGKEQPRGGVVFKTTLKLANYHESCSKCHYSLEIDTYGRGCVHNCSYCYAKDSLTKHGSWNRPHPFPVDLSEIRKIFFQVFETDKKTKWRHVLEKRVPLRIGSMSDSFMWMDKKYGVTKELLRILSHYDYPYVVFTRSDLVAEKEYLNLLRPDISAVQMSMCGTNESLTRKIEPGAPSIARRFAALQKLNDEGIWTAIRINPLIPMYPDGYFTDPEYILKRFGYPDKVPSLPFFDLNAVDDFLRNASNSGTRTILAGVVRLTSSSMNQFSKSTGVNYRDFFKPDAFKTLHGGNTDKNYTDKEIAYYYRLLKSKCDQQKLRFTTCYIGNGIKDYYQHQNLWANRSDCCDIKGNVSGFKTTSQDVSWENRKKHSPKPFFAERAIAQERMYEKFSTDVTEPTSAEMDLSALPKTLFRQRLKQIENEESSRGSS